MGAQCEEHRLWARTATSQKRAIRRRMLLVIASGRERGRYCTSVKQIDRTAINRHARPWTFAFDNVGLRKATLIINAARSYHLLTHWQAAIASVGGTIWKRNRAFAECFCILPGAHREKDNCAEGGGGIGIGGAGIGGGGGLRIGR